MNLNYFLQPVLFVFLGVFLIALTYFQKRSETRDIINRVDKKLGVAFIIASVFLFMYVFYINSHIGVRISPGDLAEIMFISTALLFFPCTIVSMTALHGVYTIFKEDVDSKIRNNSLFVLIPCIVAPIGVFITVVRHVTI